MSLDILGYLLIIIIAAFCGGALLKSVRQPPVIGYLFAGLFLGLFFGDKLAPSAINFLSELGVVLLLFTLGLEFSLARLKKLGSLTLAGTTVQLILSMFLGTVALLFFGFDFYQSFFAASAFSLSSTAIIVKLLTDRSELETVAGEIMVEWLIIQDLAVLPLIILLPVIGKQFFGSSVHPEGLYILLLNLALSAALLSGLLVVGRKLIPFILNKIAALNSRELLLTAIFGVAIFSAYLTDMMGLSAALGAFLSGLLISESVQKHAVFSEIRPLRDLFALMFFTTLGLILPAGFLFEHLVPVLLLTFIIITIKFIVVLIISLYSGYHAKTSFILAVGLVEVGEFAFILASTGFREQVISEVTYGYILSVGLLSILLMPLLYVSTPNFYTWIREFTKKRFKFVYLTFFAKYEHHDSLEELPLSDHVVLCGYGRVGKYIGRALEMAQVPYIVIENNQQKVTGLKSAGVKVVYGDPADVDILDYAQVDHAKAVIIAIPDFMTQKQVIVHSLNLNKDIAIYCRTHLEEHQQLLKALGVTSIIQPEFEASISIVDKILKSFGTKPDEIEGKISRLKIEHGLG